MLFAKPAVIVACAALSHAFLLPPSISSADTDIIKSLPVEVIAQAKSQVVNLQCTSCPVAVAEKGGRTAWIQGLKSFLQLEFSVIHEDSNLDAISMNGVQIFPPRMDQAPEMLTALQVAAGSSPSDASNQNLRLGYQLSIHPVARTKTDDLELIALRFQIVEIGNQFVDGLDSVELKLLRLPAGNLVIADIETAPTSNPALDPSQGGADCTSLLCKLKSILAGKPSQMMPKKGCGRKAGGPFAATSGEGHFRHHGRPGRNGSHRGGYRGHHHRHHGFARFIHAMKRVALHVLAPILIGIAVGMTASIVGMIAGQMIVFFWRAVYRNDHRHYTQVEQEGTEEEFSDEKEPIIEHQGPPPVYDEVTKDEKTAQ
jgi:hypothetical protein